MDHWATMELFNLPLSQVLELPAFSNCFVVAGHNGLERSVCGINQLDAPDIKNWVRPNELIITTGFVVKDNPSALDLLIPSLSRLSLAGLCIKPKRFIKDIPPSMIQIADELDFPLIELAEDCHFDTILKDYFTTVLNRQTEFLQQILGLNELLMKMILEGVELNRIADKLSLLVENSVLITDTLNDRQAFSSFPRDLGADILPRLEAEKTPENSYFLPLNIDGKNFGEVCIWATHRPVRTEDIAVINRLLLPVTLEVSREYSLREIENRHFNDFLIHLFNDSITDEDHELQRAKNLHIDPSKPHVMACLSMPEQSPHNKYNGYMRTASVLNDITVLLQRRGFSCRIAKDGTVCNLIITAPGDAVRTLSGIKKPLSEILQHVGSTYPLFITAAGCGRVYHGIKGLIRGHQEALHAMRMCESAPGQKLLFYSDLGLIRLVYSQTPVNESECFIQENLGELLALAPRKRDELLETLGKYFDCLGNLKRMSEEMYTHYNTVGYRIRRIQEITGRDLGIEEDRFCLETALKLYRFAQHAQSGAAEN